MATPESNTLLALQLFRQPAEDYAERSGQLNRVLMGIAQNEREMAGRRELAGFQATREDARWKAQGQREDARIAASDDRQEKAIAAAEKRQSDAITAKDKADIQNEIDRMYPLYAEAAARAGLPIKQREEFESTRAGLGKLTAEGKIAERAYQDTQQDLSARSAISELESKRAIVEDAKKRYEDLSNPSDDDRTMARSSALAAVKNAIDAGTIDSVKGLSKDAISKGLVALGKGDKTVATGFLGEEVVRAFETATFNALETLPTNKARLQDQRLAHQEYQTHLGDLRRIDSDLRKAQASNPKLAKQLADFRESPLQGLMGVTPKPKADFGSVTPARKNTPAAAPAASPAPGSSSLFWQNPNMMSGRGGIMPMPAPSPARAKPMGSGPWAPILNIPEEPLILPAPRRPAPLLDLSGVGQQPAPIIQLPQQYRDPRWEMLGVPPL